MRPRRKTLGGAKPGAGRIPRRTAPAIPHQPIHGNNAHRGHRRHLPGRLRRPAGPPPARTARRCPAGPCALGGLRGLCLAGPPHRRRRTRCRLLPVGPRAGHRPVLLRRRPQPPLPPHHQRHRRMRRLVFGRLPARRPEPREILPLSVCIHGLDARSRRFRQPRPPVHFLGAHKPDILFAHRLPPRERGFAAGACRRCW